MKKRTLEVFLKRPQYELYDMKSDPNEVNNLAYQQEYQELLHFYIQKLYDFQEETDDIWKVYQYYEQVKNLLSSK